MPECQICYNSDYDFKVFSSCKHEVCRLCFSKILEMCEKLENKPTCPYCRAPIKEAIEEDFEVEDWLSLDVHEWQTYSITLKNGTEVIKSYKNHDTQPTWRNNDNVIILKRNRSRKKYRKNKRQNI